MKKHKVYNNMREWYHPEIGYRKMLKLFKWTHTELSRLVKREAPFNFHHLLLHSGQHDITKPRGFGTKQLFQFWNRQFNDALATEIRKLNPRLVLEVGAGNGMLSQLLAKRGIPIKATDDYSWNFDERHFDVEKISYKKAIKKYEPDVIIVSWMNLGTNWTPDFRGAKSTKHYILIGEGEGGCTGGEWEARRGWKMRYLAKPSKYAVARSDSIWNEDEVLRSHTDVLLFSRKATAKEIRKAV